jgi:hypothetical protein
MVDYDERIADFQRETGAELPVVKHLTENECEQLRHRIAARLNLVGSDGVQIVETLRSRQVLLSANICDEDFYLLNVLTDANIRPLPFIYVNWGMFNVIDRFETPFITRYLQDLLYPGGDYVEIFDDGINWIASIDYESYIRLLVI